MDAFAGRMTARGPTLSADPRILDGRGAWMHRLATEHGQADVALRLTHLFGHATCPACQETFLIADVVTADLG